MLIIPVLFVVAQVIVTPDVFLEAVIVSHEDMTPVLSTVAGVPFTGPPPPHTRPGGGSEKKKEKLLIYLGKKHTIK